MLEKLDTPSLSETEGRAGDPVVIKEWLRGHQTRLDEWTPVDIATLRYVSLAFASGESLEAVCEQLIVRLADLLSADNGAIFLTDVDDWVRPIASKGLTADHLQSLESAAAWAVRKGRPIRMKVSNSTEGTASNRAGNSGDSLCIPVLLQGRKLGAFVLSRAPGSIQFDDRDVAVAVSLANEIALSMDRAQVQSQLGQEQIKTSLTQRQLEVYAKDFRSTFIAERERAAQLAGALSQLESTYLATVRSLAAAVEAKDEYTGGHLTRVTRYGLSILKRISPELARNHEFAYGFLLHDVGKLTIPDAILCKRGPLTEEEWEIMRRHPHSGRHILNDIPFLGSANEIVLSHHERWDGRGYPHRLSGEEIPLGARVFAVADSYDAMTTDRPYRKAMTYEAARRELRTHSGRQFWPDAVDAFLSIPKDEIVTAGANDTSSILVPVGGS